MTVHLIATSSVAGLGFCDIRQSSHANVSHVSKIHQPS